jgi:UDP-GlcNAc:undecaprenyl-phosphate GlcNAc-1-phosphate transferase
MGLTHRRAVLTLYGVSIVFTVTAIAVSVGRSWQGGVAICVASLVAIALFRSMGYLDYLVRMNRQKVRVRLLDTELLRRAVPKTLASLSATNTEPEVWSALEAMLAASGLANAEVKDEAGACVRAWEGRPDVDRDELVSARFPIGADNNARTSIVFRWAASDREVNPQTEILLQVAVDALSEALSRSRSALAPRPAPEPRAEPAPSSARARVSA